MKYFAKYLPVEGEIKEGDKVRYKWPNKDFTLETVLEVAKNGDVKTNSKNFPFLLKDSTQLFKLFLCSRDIQVGDKVLSPETLVECEAGALSIVSFESYKVYGYFKVIGEISPNALWVKEGDEFDEDNVKLIYIKRYSCLCPHENGSLCKDEYLVDNHRGGEFCIRQIDVLSHVEINCPTCKTFH